MNSCLYEGVVHHARQQPVVHRFTYRLFMVALDLSELDTVFRGRWFWSTRRPAPAWFRRRDHFGDPGRPLEDEVRDRVEERLGRRPVGRIRLVTHLRYFGLVFNPISIYLCLDESGSALDAIVLEVSNTPWGERCLYVVDARRPFLEDGRPVHLFDKTMHVSPFMGMDYRYALEVALRPASLFVRLQNRGAEGTPFTASLSLRRLPLTGRNLGRMMLLYPVMTLRVLAAIYYQAGRLALKRTPVYPHPAHRGIGKEVPQS